MPVLPATTIHTITVLPESFGYHCHCPLPARLRHPERHLGSRKRASRCQCECQCPSQSRHWCPLRPGHGHCSFTAQPASAHRSGQSSCTSSSLPVQSFSHLPAWTGPFSPLRRHLYYPPTHRRLQPSASCSTFHLPTSNSTD